MLSIKNLIGKHKIEELSVDIKSNLEILVVRLNKLFLLEEGYVSDLWL